MKFQALFLLLPLAMATPAPILTSPVNTPIPGQYIVKFKSTYMRDQKLRPMITRAMGRARKRGADTFEFGTFGGFCDRMNNSMVERVRGLPMANWVEQDVVMSLDSDKIVKRDFVTQTSTSSTWGLGRISYLNPNAGNYTYDRSAGVGTCVYVVGTGIQTKHPEFEGRATFLANLVGDGVNTDNNGHGTHVAGTIASKTYGVAKRARLFAVKVLKTDGSGALSGVVAGINFAVNDAKTRNCRGTVLNLSLGGGKSTTLNSAAANAVSAGVFLAVAAGNSAIDASNASPASEPTVFTVGATDSNDQWASFSNFGPAVDMLAPGVAVLSTWKDNGAAVLSGTSMATPHVAGLAAYLLALEGRMTPAALSARILSLANGNRITGVPAGTINLLAFNGNPKG
ncbi:subtilisin-like serine protease-like protein PR1A [Plenodomus tracheiphilus IPT5]|uniref:Subtilisin-like serine protease-like protein PR1A n=1 Tax=Plenodomus tracheiphilus IPT5 TaxID=1408161 RepID=A0A6A7B0J6_9PLEO|nr:subtilisin-like serine protease-like protein PR1A [Plenodomus tracheiphilus IPT5]